MTRFEFLNRTGQPYLMGHRGVMGLCPENTLRSFREAIRLGVAMIELDVHLTRDGALAVIHDERLERTTTGTGLVGEQTADELRRCDAGVKFAPEFAGEKIPLLGEVLALAAAAAVAVNLEIKNGPVFYPGIAEAVVRCVRDHGLTERVVVSSFDHCALWSVREADAALPTAPLANVRLHQPVRYLRELHANGFHPRWNYVTRDVVDELHRAGFFVNTWIISTVADYQRFAAWGLDAVGVNDPRPFAAGP